MTTLTVSQNRNHDQLLLLKKWRFSTLFQQDRIQLSAIRQDKHSLHAILELYSRVFIQLLEFDSLSLRSHLSTTGLAMDVLQNIGSYLDHDVQLLIKFDNEQFPTFRGVYHLAYYYHIRANYHMREKMIEVMENLFYDAIIPTDLFV